MKKSQRHLEEPACCDAFSAPLPETGDTKPPEWITPLPQLGRISTRDGRAYTIDGEALVRRYKQDGADIPIDLDHSLEKQINSPNSRIPLVVGWIVDMRVNDGALEGRVDWLDEGKRALNARSHRYASPAFLHTKEGLAVWIRSVGLVPVPALTGQRALASAQGGCAMGEEIFYDIVATPLASVLPLTEWIVAFPSVGFVETEREEIFAIDGKAICDDFTKRARSRGDDFREFPVYASHKPDKALDEGVDDNSEPLGYVEELRIDAGRVMARVAWSRDAADVIRTKKLLCASPTFFCEAGGKVKRLKSLSLVTRSKFFAKARGVGNDVSPYDRAYTPNPPPAELSAGGASSTRICPEEAISLRCAQLAAVGQASEADLLFLRGWQYEIAQERAGIPIDKAWCSAQARNDVASGNALKSMFPQGGVTITGVVQMDIARQRLESCAAKSGIAGGGFGKGADKMSVAEMTSEAEAEMARARASGNPIDILQAVGRVMERHGLDIDQMDDAARGVAPEERERQRAMTPEDVDAEYAAHNKRNEANMVEARRIESAAKKLMNEAAKNGTSLSYLDAITQVTAGV